MMDWQPIETAPKDGTWVILGGGKTTEEPMGDDKVDVKRPVVAFWNENSWKGWEFCYWDGAWREGYENPTHWMSLTTPPEGEE